MAGTQSHSLITLPTVRRRQRKFWQFSSAEARAHALIVACVMWAVAAAVLTFGTPYRDFFGQLKWTDFVHFYTLGDIARNGPTSALYDAEAQYSRQVTLVPESAPERYLPAYPPQVALLFAPLSALPYLSAGAVWAFFSLAVCAGTLWLAWRPLRSVLNDRALLVAAAAAFPPFWSLVLNGQTTAVPIVAFSGGMIALLNGRRLLAGLLLGLLLMKPQFGLMLAVVVLGCREWSMLAGIVLSGATQSLAVSILLGPSVMADYIAVVPRLAAMQGALEPSFDQMHSFAAVTGLLPSPLDTTAWVATSACIAFLTLRVWRSAADVPVKMAALAIGSILINPHVNFYDVSAMAAPLLWISVCFESPSGRLYELRHQWRVALYIYFALLLFPSARLITLQLSPVVPVWLMYLLAYRAEERRSSALAGVTV